MLEFLWTVVGFGMAVYSTYMLLSQASLAQSETLTEAHVTRAPSPKAKAPAAPKKEPEVQSPEQARLRELKRGYEAAKLARDRHGRDCEESSILNAEEIEKLKGVVSRLQDKHRQVEADRAVQTERIARYGKRHTEIGEKIKAGKHDVSTEDGQLKRLQREVEEAVRAAVCGRREGKGEGGGERRASLCARTGWAADGLQGWKLGGSVSNVPLRPYLRRGAHTHTRTRDRTRPVTTLRARRSRRTIWRRS